MKLYAPESKLQKALKAAQAFMLALTLVTMSSPVSVLAQEVPPLEETVVQQVVQEEPAPEETPAPTPEEDPAPIVEEPVVEEESAPEAARTQETSEEKINICHKTESEQNPWNAIRIDESALATHQGHGDFLYAGPTKDGKPDNKDGKADKWCENNAPEEEPEVPPYTPHEDTKKDGQCVVVSDTLTKEGADAAVLVSNPPTAWTAVFDSIAKWIWGEDPTALTSGVSETETFTREFSVLDAANGATLAIAADNSYVVTINGNPVGADAGEFNYTSGGQDNYAIPADDLLVGTNTITFVVTNKDVSGETPASNPAGLRYKLTVNGTDCGVPVIVENTCVAPSTLDTSSVQTFGGTEQTLQNILDTATPSYAVDVDEDQTNFQQWNGTNNTVDFSVKFIKGIAGDKHVFGYVANGGAFVPVFKDHASIGAPYAATPLASSGPFNFSVSNVSNVVFAIHDVTSNKFYYTKTALNTSDNKRHAVVFNPADDQYVIAFEDLENQGDKDFNDLVVEVKVTGCEDEEVAVCEPNVELLSNGNFETPEVTNGAGWDAFATGTGGLVWIADFLDGGAPATGKAELQESGLNGWLSTGTGNQWTELDSDWQGPSGGSGEAGAVALSQDVPTEVGETYTIRFDFSPRPGTAAAQNKVQVLADGNSLGYVGPLAASSTQTQWIPQSFSFVASDSVTTITLQDAGTPNDSLGSFVDNASVMCTPEEPEEEVATLHAVKIVCPAETMLPNWGAGNVVSAISSTTATQFLAQNPQCSLQPWSFQWATDAAGDPVDNGTTPLDLPWVTFSAGTPVEIPEGTNLRVREVLQNGYVPFTGQNTDQNVSAELYCGTDVLHYDNWEWMDNVQAGEDYYCVAFNAPVAPQTGEVTMCKTNENGAPLSGWTLNLLGDFVEDVVVDAADVDGVNTVTALTGGASYVALAEGTWLNARNPDNQVDTEYSSEDNWSTQMDGFTGYGTEILELQINGGFGNWGVYNSTHSYARSFTQGSNGTANIGIYDTYYGDNSGTLAVSLYEGYSGITGQDGCVTFQNVPYGNYTVTEVQQDGWYLIDLFDGETSVIESEGSVSVNAPEEVFTVVNEFEEGGGGDDDTGTLVIKKYTEGGDGEFEFEIYRLYEEEYERGDAEAYSSVFIETEDGVGSTTIELDEGEYDLTEFVPKGWTLQNSYCEYEGDSEGISIDYGERIYIDEDDTVTCTFINTKNGVETETSNTTVVSGNTSAGNNLLGWLFNRDPLTSSPFAFSAGNASIGTGSLFVSPITNTNTSGAIGNNPDKDKFIGELFLLTPMEGFKSFTWDFKIAAPNDTVANQFYMNVYANFGASDPTKFYDCRYDIVATVGSTAGFTTVTFDPTQPYTVTTRTGGSASPFTCPAIPAQMDTVDPGTNPAVIRVIALNVGDTSASDTGVGGYLDKVVTVIKTGTNTHTETYDFEPVSENPSTPEEEDDRQSRSGSSSGNGNAFGEVLGASACSALLTDYLKMGWANNPDEVTKLQQFLNEHMGFALPLSGFFGPATHEAVKAFQQKYWEGVLQPWFGQPDSGITGQNTPTGFVYQTTRWQINNIFCPGSEAFPTNLD